MNHRAPNCRSALDKQTGWRQYSTVPSAAQARVPASADDGGRRPVRRGWWSAGAIVLAIAVAAALVFLQMRQTRWVEVIQAVAPNESASSLELVIGVCNPSLPLPPPKVTETKSEVRISVDLRDKYSGDTKACASGATVTLRSPLGTRLVIDGHSGHEVEVILTDTGSTAARP